MLRTGDALAGYWLDPRPPRPRLSARHRQCASVRPGAVAFGGHGTGGSLAWYQGRCATVFSTGAPHWLAEGPTAAQMRAGLVCAGLPNRRAGLSNLCATAAGPPAARPPRLQLPAPNLSPTRSAILPLVASRFAGGASSAPSARIFRSPQNTDPVPTNNPRIPRRRPASGLDRCRGLVVGAPMRTVRAGPRPRVLRRVHPKRKRSVFV